MKARMACLALIGLVLGVAWSAGSSNAVQPPGVDKMEWIAISDNAGVVVGPASPYADRSKPILSGRLMVRRGSTWYHIDLTPTEYRRAQ